MAAYCAGVLVPVNQLPTPRM